MSELQGVYASYDELTPQKAQDLWDAGVRVYSQQLWTAAEAPALRVPNLQTAQTRGFALVGPIAINGSRPGAWHVDQARAGVPDDLWAALALAPIDVELESIPNEEIRRAVERAAALGKRRSVYCSIHTWRDNQGDPHGFGDCLCYIAQYDGSDTVADVRLPSGLAGAQIVGKQYTNTQQTHGLESCLEVWNGELLGGRMYTDAEIDAKVGEALALGVRNQTNMGELANGLDALPPLKGQLRYLWSLASKAWPF